MRTADEAGVVVVQATGSHRRLMHLGAPPNGERTVCGRYRSDRYEPPETNVAGLRMCGVCAAVAEKRNDYRWKGRRHETDAVRVG
jgi:hypothetical protein